MEYKVACFDKKQKNGQNCSIKSSENLTIDLDIETDIQDLENSINECLNSPDKENVWSDLDNLFQQGLSKLLTKEQSIYIIDTYYQLLQVQSFYSCSALRVIKSCLKKCRAYVPPEIIDFLFHYSISHIKCYSKISVINESFCIMILILPFTTEDHHQFFIDFISSEYPQICLMDGFPHASFLICIRTYFEFCSVIEVLPSFEKISNIILSFLQCKLWGLPFDAIKIIEVAIKKDVKICHILLENQNKLINILTELASRELEALSIIVIDTFTLIIKACEIIQIEVKSIVDTNPNEPQEEKSRIALNETNETFFLNTNDICDFINVIIKFLPTNNMDLEIKVVRCIAQSILIGLDPLIAINQTTGDQFNLFELVQKTELMIFEQKKAILLFSSVILQTFPQQFIQQFIESDDGNFAELAFESINSDDEEMILHSLNIILVLMQYRQSFIDGERYDDSVNNYLSILEPDIDLDEIGFIENEEIRRLASLIDELILFDQEYDSI